MKRISVFGDSFVEGVGDHEKGGWAFRLQDKLRGSYDFFIDGLGGRNVVDIKKQIFSYFKNNSTFCILLNVGINDSRYRESKGGLETPPEDFTATYSSIIDHALKNNVDYILLIGLSRVDENLVYDYKPDKSHRNSDAEIIDKAVASLSDDKTIIYVPVANVIHANRTPSTLYDGLHPNSTGHDLICNSVLQTLLDHKIIE